MHVIQQPVFHSRARLTPLVPLPTKQIGSSEVKHAFAAPGITPAATAGVAESRAAFAFPTRIANNLSEASNCVYSFSCSSETPFQYANQCLCARGGGIGNLERGVSRKCCKLLADDSICRDEARGMGGDSNAQYVLCYHILVLDSAQNAMEIGNLAKGW